MSKAPIWAVTPPGGRKPRFTREQIADVALALADKEGFEALSMRRIAEELGAGTMTLYYYVRTKDDLFTLIDDALIGEVVEHSKPLPKTWRPAVTKIARAMRDAFVRHPWALHWMRGARVGPNNLRHVEQSLEAVDELRCDVRTKLQLLSIVDDYVFGHVLRVSEATESPPPDAKSVRAINDLTRAQLATGEYPHLAAMIGDEPPMDAFYRFGEQMSEDARFDIGLEALLDGLTVRLKLKTKR